jgi:hypothetical protein
VRRDNLPLSWSVAILVNDKNDQMPMLVGLLNPPPPLSLRLQQAARQGRLFH